VLLAVSAFVPAAPVFRVDILVVSMLPPPVEPALVVLAPLAVSVAIGLLPSVVTVAESELVLLLLVPELQLIIPNAIPQINNFFICKLFAVTRQLFFKYIAKRFSVYFK
jgi:hypothetical protein